MKKIFSLTLLVLTLTTVNFCSAVFAGTATKAISITVNNVNRAPTITPTINNQTLNENAVTDTVLTISDPDGENINTASLVVKYTNGTSAPAFISLTGSGTGSTITRTLHIAPGYSDSGTYNSLRVEAADSNSIPLTGYSSTFNVTVNNVNRAPTLTQPTDKTIAENSLLAFSLSATDLDNDTLTYSSTTLPSGATLNPTTGAFSWTPGFTQAGAYVVTYIVNDGKGGSDSKTHTITVTDTNRVPVWTVTPPQTIPEGNSLTFVVSATDADNDPLTYSNGTLPQGAAFNVTTRTFTWTPGSTQAGEYDVTFNVTDNKSPVVPQIVHITVTNINQAPVFDAFVPPAPYSVNEGSLISIIVKAHDPDGADVTITQDVGSKGSLGAVTCDHLTTNTCSATYTWTPSFTDGNVTPYSVTFTANDNQMAPNSESTLTIKGQDSNVEEENK